jgi:hypothetical protein
MKAKVTLARGRVPIAELQSWFTCIAIKFPEVEQHTTISVVVRPIIQMVWG